MRTLIVLCLIALGVGGACDRKGRELRTGHGAGSSSEAWPRLYGSNVTELAIEGEPRVVLRRAGPDAWMLVEPETGPVDPAAIGGALGELSTLEWSAAPIATDRASWAEHRVTPDEVITLRVQHEGLALPPVHLGPTGRARFGDADAVWEYYRLQPVTFAREVRLWRDRRVFDFDPNQVTRLLLVDPTGRLEATRTPDPGDAPSAAGDTYDDPASSAPRPTMGQWSLIPARSTIEALDPEAAEGLVRLLSVLTAHDLVTGLGGDRAGFDTSPTRIEVELGQRRHVLHIGAALAGGRYRYASVEGDPRIFAIDAEGAATVIRPPAALAR